MARGRMLSRSICKSMQVHGLSSDLCRLGFTWAIPHLDVNGVMHGDPALMRSDIFPRRDDVSNKDMRRMRDEWVQSELAHLFHSTGDEWLFFPGFDRHQTGLRKDRETKSGHPPPPENLVRQTPVEYPEDVRKESGDSLEGIPPKRREEKIKEEKIKEEKGMVRQNEIVESIHGDNGNSTSLPSEWDCFAKRARTDLEDLGHTNPVFPKDGASKIENLAFQQLLSAWIAFGPDIPKLLEKSVPPILTFLNQLDRWTKRTEEDATHKSNVPPGSVCDDCGGRSTAPIEWNDELICQNCAKNRRDADLNSRGNDRFTEIGAGESVEE